MARTLQMWSEKVDCELIIILDQFEEYFLYHPHEDGPGTLASELPAAVNSPSLRASFLFSIRDDSIARLDRFKGRIPKLFENYLRIDHLNREAARAATEKPIEYYNRLLDKTKEPIRIEPALVEEVLNQVKTGLVSLSDSGRGVVGGGLQSWSAGVKVEAPFLQLVMSQVWDAENRTGSHTLRLETLRRLGGAELIVRTHLDTALGTLSASEATVAAVMFHYLVTPTGTKIAHTIPDLAEFVKLPQTELYPILQRLSAPDLRILRPVAPPPDHPDIPAFEVFHDILAPAILEWRARQLQSRERADVEHRAEEQKRLAEGKARTASRLWKLAVMLAFVSLLALGAAVFGVIQNRRARHERNLALHQARIADSLRIAQLAALDTAEARRLQAERMTMQSRLLRARSLAAEAIINLDRDPELSLLLALYSASFTYSIDKIVPPETHDALNRAVQESRIRFLLTGHSDVVHSVAYSPDGKRLASASMDGTVKVWDVNSKQILLDLSGAGAVYSVAFRPNGESLASGSLDGKVKIWNARSGRLLNTLVGHTGAVYRVVFSPNGKLLVSVGADTRVRLWDAASGRLLHILSGHTAAVRALAFSPDGKNITTGGDDQEVKIWDIATGKEVRTLHGSKGTVYGVAFSPDGVHLATASINRDVRVWHLPSAREVLTLSGHSAPVNAVAFSPNGQLLATASDDKKVKVWDMTAARETLLLLGHDAAVIDLVFSPDGTRLATAGADKQIKGWDISNDQGLFIVRSHRAAVNSVAFSPQGDYLATASADCTVKVQSSASGQVLFNLAGHTEAVNDIVFSSETRYLASASNDNTARVWDVANGREITRVTHETDAKAVAISPDAKLLATACSDESAKVWDIETGQERLTHTNGVNDIAFSPDGTRIVTASAEGIVKLWELSSGRELSTLSRENLAISSFAISPNGARFATAGPDGKVNLWTIASGLRFLTLAAHTSAVNDVAFSPDGTGLTTVGDDGTAKLWGIPSGRLLLTFSGHQAAVNSCDFSPDGRRLATAGDDTTVRVHALMIEDLIALAQTRVTRGLSLSECQKYLKLEECPAPTF
jgi:WD40 repeat protein